LVNKKGKEMKSNFSVIEDKLNGFIRKFYSNRIIWGILLFVMVFAITGFIAFLSEGFLFLQPFVKTVLFYFVVFLLLSVLTFFVVVPLLKVLKILPVITFEEASKIISNYFQDSNDLLVNILQLNGADDGKSDFLVAAINQKIEKISPWNFVNAIDFKKTSRFLMYSVGVLIIVLSLSFLFSNRIKQGAERFLNYSTYYEKENPYTFKLLSDTLTCLSGDDIDIKVQIAGPNVLKDVFLSNDEFSVRMNSDSAGYYSYTLKNLISDFDFRVDYLNYRSSIFKVRIFAKPQVLNYSVQVFPPAYTKAIGSEFENTGDLTVPSGSKILWNYTVADCKNFSFYIDSTKAEIRRDDDKISVEKLAKKSFDYHFSIDGENSYNQTSDMFHVNLIPDYYPSVQVVSATDSTVANALYFSGHISDDYGFHSLNFVYFEPDKPEKLHYEKIEFNNESLSQDFFYYYDFSDLKKTVTYYFEVRDNDAIAGYKSSKTAYSTYTTTTNREKQERIDNLQSSMNDKVEKAQSLLKELNSDINDFQKSVAANKDLSEWEKKLKLDNLMEKQNKLKSLLQEISEENQFKNAFENQLSPEQNEELVEKQKQLQQLWDNLMTDDIKKLMDEISQLAKELSEKNMRENIQNLKFDYNQISEQLERNNTLMKMFNVENKLHNISNEMRELSKDLKNTSEKLSEDDLSKTDKEDLAQQMKNIKESFEQEKKNYENLQNLNEELGENMLDIPDMKDKMTEIENELKNEFDKMSEISQKDDNSNGNNDKRKSGEKDSRETKSDNRQLQEQMQDTADELEEMSNEMQGLQQQNQQQKNEENINDIRQILDNLLTLSFSEEEIMNQVKNGSNYLGSSVPKQIAVKRDFVLVQDSIYALARREPELGHSVYEKIKDINLYLNKVESEMNENHKTNAVRFQQSVLTGFNDLSLLFSEIQDQMQNQQNQSSSSSSQQNSSRQESKNKKQMAERQQNMQQMKNQQQSLKETLEKMLQQLQKGDNPNNKQLAESLKQMELMQQQLRQMQNKGGNTPQQQQLLNQMNQLLEDSKRDIVNRNINKTLLERQNQVFNKLLELENAEKKQDFDEKRESKQATELQQQSKEDLKLKFKKFGTKEFLNAPTLNLNLFYQNKYSEYLQNIE
jgi:hypothetical protein